MNKESIQIALAGDVMIGRMVNEYLDNAPSSYLWGNCLPLLKQVDLRLINLEAALTVSEKAVPKVFNFKVDPPKVQILIDASIDVVNLANNHVLDFDKDGLFETLNTLDKAGIKHVGAGKNLQEASQPVIITKKGIKIGILGCTDNEPTWAAAPTTPGIRYIKVGDINAIKPDIESLRKQVDLLILSIHWGPNMRERPTRTFIQFAHQLIDSGVDILHGHSAHIFQAVETYQNKLILYDTGDFVDDYYVDPSLRNDRSFLFLINATKEKILSLKCTPSFISNCQVNLAPPDEAEKAMSHMKSLCAEFHTNMNIENDSLVLSLK